MIQCCSAESLSAILILFFISSLIIFISFFCINLSYIRKMNSIHRLVDVQVRVLSVNHINSCDNGSHVFACIAEAKFTWDASTLFQKDIISDHQFTIVCIFLTAFASNMASLPGTQSSFRPS